MNMATIERTPRALESRAADARPTMWKPPELLPDPTPEAGFSFRWIRLSTLGEADAMNISAKLREGWEPVKASDHPEMQILGSSSARFPGGIEIGGLLLCKTPTEFVEQRDAYYRGQAHNQMESVDNTLMRENNPKMPLFKNRQTQVTFGSGT